MNYKLDYITKVLQKTSKKRIENYVISRIWHLLNNNEIKIISQQYIKRSNNSYALTDLFLPQINYHVEVNEDFHYKNEKKIDLDQVREKEIIEVTKNHIFRFINCENDKSLEQINSQIDDIVIEITSLISELKKENKFISWEVHEFEPQFWKNRGKLNYDENINLRTIDDIGQLFDIQIKNRGFLKPGAAKFEKNGINEIWWPEKKETNNWINEYENDFQQILESHKNVEKGKNHLEQIIGKKSEYNRIVFFKRKDDLGFNFYKFVGCYKLNFEKSLTSNKVVWERFSKEYIL